MVLSSPRMSRLPPVPRWNLKHVGISSPFLLRLRDLLSCMPSLSHKAFHRAVPYTSITELLQLLKGFETSDSLLGSGSYVIFRASA